ncbi:hypothetical protein EC991_003913 [Linnemannia zychae]|nr:hypothetical protein EC991_003913 [Linnemannia zychae]
MGKIELICLTADPGRTTLYGFAFGYSSYEAHKNGEMNTWILIKSQANPSDVTNIKWSAVSVFNTGESLTSMSSPDASDQVIQSCAINSAGVFTSIMRVRGSDHSEKPMRVVRFDPTGGMAPEQDFAGGGTWSTTQLAHSFNMTEYPIISEHKLFYDNNTLQIGNIATLAYGNSQLFMYDHNNLAVIAIPLSNSTNTPTPSIKRFEPGTKNYCSATSGTGFHSGLWKNSYFLLCGEGNNGYLETINSILTDTTSTAKQFQGGLSIIQNTPYSQPIGGHLPGQDAFIVMANANSIQGVTLTGLSAGSYQTTTNVYVNGVYGSDGSEASVQDENITPSSALSPAAMWAIIASCLVLLVSVGVFVFMRYRRSRRSRAVIVDSTDEPSEKYSLELGSSPFDETELKNSKLGIDMMTTAIVPPLTGLTSHPRPDVTTSLGSKTPKS